MDHAADESRRERRKLNPTSTMKYCLLLLLAAGGFCLGGCADGIEPDREIKAAGYAPDPTVHIPRRDDSPQRAAGF